MTHYPPGRGKPPHRTGSEVRLGLGRLRVYRQAGEGDVSDQNEKLKGTDEGTGPVELTEEDLAQVAGGTDAAPLVSINKITFGIQKDKMQSANKNAEAIRSLL
jgi:hypothetical protein